MVLSYVAQNAEHFAIFIGIYSKTDVFEQLYFRKKAEEGANFPVPRFKRRRPEVSYHA
jgi:hypothetical protein